MTGPKPAVWAATKKRDGNRCIRCLIRINLTFQHRKATGMGGSKIPPTVVEGVVACLECNERFEGDLQGEALECGWKVRGKREFCPRIPVFYRADLAWFRLVGERREQITVREAERMFEDVYGLAA